MPKLTARAVVDLLKPCFGDGEGEKLVLLFLDSDQAVLAIEERDREPGDSIEFPMRSAIARALELDARGLIVAHDHPSGDAHPSDADIALTGRLADTAAAVGILLHDHLIFADGSHFSFRQMGLL